MAHGNWIITIVSEAAINLVAPVFSSAESELRTSQVYYLRSKKTIQGIKWENYFVRNCYLCPSRLFRAKIVGGGFPGLLFNWFLRVDCKCKNGITLGGESRIFQKQPDIFLLEIMYEPSNNPATTVSSLLCFNSRQQTEEATWSYVVARNLLMPIVFQEFLPTNSGWISDLRLFFACSSPVLLPFFACSRPYSL